MSRSRSAGVPRQPHQHGAVAAVVVFVLLLESPRDLVVHLLIVVFGGGEDLGRGRGFRAGGDGIVSRGAKRNDADADVEARPGGLGRGVGVVAARGAGGLPRDERRRRAEDGGAGREAAEGSGGGHGGGREGGRWHKR